MTFKKVGTTASGKSITTGNWVHRHCPTASIPALILQESQHCRTGGRPQDLRRGDKLLQLGPLLIGCSCSK